MDFDSHICLIRFFYHDIYQPVDDKWWVRKFGHIKFGTHTTSFLSFKTHIWAPRLVFYLIIDYKNLSKSFPHSPVHAVGFVKRIISIYTTDLQFPEMKCICFSPFT